MTLIDETTRQRWLELLKGGPYQPRVSPLEGVTTLLAHLLDSPLPTHMTDGVTASYVVDGDEGIAEPIPALLPRDWPRQLDEFLDALAASEAARQAAYAFVDAWVLAAATTVVADRNHDAGVDGS